VKYKAVILNFDKKTATYVAPQVATRGKKAVTTTTGTNPPARKKRP
jgi:hypothetical protein